MSHCPSWSIKPEGGRESTSTCFIVQSPLSAPAEQSPLSRTCLFYGSGGLLCLSNLCNHHSIQENMSFLHVCLCCVFGFTRIICRAGHSTTLSRQRDHVFGHTFVGYCIVTTFVLVTPSRHRDINVFRICSFSLSSITLPLSQSYTIVACPALKMCFTFYK